MTDPVIEALDVGVVRDGESILHDVSVTVDTETRLLIQGSSGAGKTTLFDILGLLDVPTSGILRVQGTDVSDIPERKRAVVRRETIGFVFQEFQLIPDLTARENVAVPQVHAGDRDDAWIETLFERLDLVEAADQYPATLSGGEKQRVGIARALANQPAVILADEPTGQLDPGTGAAVLELLVELQSATETGLVMVSHDPAVTDAFDSVRQLEDGTLK